jgi:Uma2 family endonuclease
MTKLLDEPTPAAPKPITSAAIVLNLRPVVDLTDDQFYELCRANADLRFERTAQGEILIMAPTGSRTGQRNFNLTKQVAIWADEDGTGYGFDSPDVSWIKRERWDALSDEQKEKFSPVCPDFVVELRSRTDSVAELREKMEEYVENGARLSWLIDPSERKVYVYRQGVEVETLDDPETVSGDPVLAGFVLSLQEVW